MTESMYIKQAIKNLQEGKWQRRNKSYKKLPNKDKGVYDDIVDAMDEDRARRIKDGRGRVEQNEILYNGSQMEWVNIID